jgi:Uma2 family endonuclease
MATVEASKMTAAEFWDWTHRPENEGRRFELERGEVIEMPSPRERHGILCGWISHLLWSYVLRRGSGAVSTNDTGLQVEQSPDTIRGPDLILFAESQPLDRLNPRFSTRIPQLVVEILSPGDRPNRTNRRVGQYLQRGVPLVWLVDPESCTVGVHRMGQYPVTLDESEELTGMDVLPDFRLLVAELFTLPGATPAE